MEPIDQSLVQPEGNVPTTKLELPPVVPMTLDAPTPQPEAPAPPTAPAPQPISVPADLLPIFEDASARTGVPVNVLTKIAWRESRFNSKAKNDASTAKGLFQFIDNTWNDSLARNAAVHGISTVASPFDPRASTLMAAEYARANRAAVQQATGRDIRDGEYYITHFLGTTGGVNFIKANDTTPTAPAADLFPKAAASNRTIFYDEAGRARSVREVYTNLIATVEGPQDYTAPSINFGTKLTPEFLNPPPLLPSQSDVMRANAALAAREQEVGFISGIADAYRLDTIIGRIGNLTPEFAPDPNYKLTKESLTELTKGLPEVYHERFGTAVSAVHAEWLRARSLEDYEREQNLAALGWAGTGLRVAASILDPVAVGAGIATGGLGQAFMQGAKITRAARTAILATEGAAANVAVESMLRQTGNTNAGNDLLMTAAVGAAFGSAFGILSRNPHVATEARQIQTSANSLRRELEGTTSPHSLSAAANPNAMYDVLNDPAFKAVADGDVPYTAFAGRARFDSVGQLKSSNNAQARLLGGVLGEDAVGNRNHSINPFSASEDTERMHRVWFSDLRRTAIPAYRAWADAQGLNAAQRLTNGSRFNDEVWDYVRLAGRDPSVTWDENVARLGNKIRDLNAEVLRHAQNPLHREGLTGRAVKGFETVPENPFYMMRAYAQDKINNVRARFGDRGMIEWFRGAIRSAQPGIDADLLDRLAEGMARRIHRRSNGIDDGMNAAMFGDPEELRNMLRAESVPDDRIEAFINAIRPNADVDARARHRVLLDEDYVLRGYKTRDGGTADLALRDMVITDATVLSDLYFRHMAGRIGLARVRVKNPTTDELLIDGITSDREFERLLARTREYGIDAGTSRQQLDQDEKNLRWLYERVRGVPDEDAQNKWADYLRLLRKFNFTRVMNQAGFAQIQEFSNTVGQLGIRAALQHMPDFRRIVNMDGETVLRHGLGQELEAIFGVGTDRLRGMQYFRSDDIGNYAGSTSLNRVNNALDFGQAVTAEVSGMNVVNSALQRWTGKAIVQKFANLATNPTHTNMRRMASLGLDQAMLDRILKQTQHFTREDGMLFGGKVTRMNLDNWTDQEARAHFENAVFRWSRRIIQENDVGNMHRWASKPLWQMMFQFRNFTLNAWAKQFLHNIHMGDANTFAVFMLSMVSGAAVYAVQSQLQAVGRSDKDKFLKDRLSPNRLALAAFQRSGWSSIMPMVADTGLFLSGLNPAFDFRTTGQPTDVLFGNPTMGLVDDIAKASKGIVRPALNNRSTSQQEYRNIARVIPFQNFMPNAILLSTMISGAPERAPRD